MSKKMSLCLYVEKTLYRKLSMSKTLFVEKLSVGNMNQELSSH